MLGACSLPWSSSNQYEEDLLRMLEQRVNTDGTTSPSSQPRQLPPSPRRTRPQHPRVTAPAKQPRRLPSTPKPRHVEVRTSPRAETQGRRPSRVQTTPKPPRRQHVRPTPRPTIRPAAPIPRFPRRRPTTTQRPRFHAARPTSGFSHSSGQASSYGTPRLATARPPIPSQSATIPSLVFLSSQPPPERRTLPATSINTQPAETSTTTPAPSKPVYWEPKDSKLSVWSLFNVYTALTIIISLSVVYLALCTVTGCCGGFYFTR